jgi:hypothetical protein
MPREWLSATCKAMTKADLDTAVARLKTKIGELAGRVALVRWMLAFNLAATLSVFGLALRMMLR